VNNTNKDLVYLGPIGIPVNTNSAVDQNLGCQAKKKIKKKIDCKQRKKRSCTPLSHARAFLHETFLVFMAGDENKTTWLSTIHRTSKLTMTVINSDHPRTLKVIKDQSELCSKL
jgi:hypothetical protein